MKIGRGKGICPRCKAVVRLVRFRGSTSDSRDGVSVIGRHMNANPKIVEHCGGEQLRPFGTDPMADEP